MLEFGLVEPEVPEVPELPEVGDGVVGGMAAMVQ